LLDGDGCTEQCALDCDGLLDPKTGTCYFVASPEVEVSQAADRCGEFGEEAHILHLSSRRERALVAEWLDGTELLSAMAGLFAAEPTGWWSLSDGYPGWSETKQCPGCHADWAEGQPDTPGLKRLAVMARASGWRWVSATHNAPYPLVCERPRPGRPANLCQLPSCDPNQSYEFAMLGHRYRVRRNTLNVAAAQEDCRAWGGNLVVIDDADEREMLVRLGPSLRFWIGLYRPEGKDWIWVDGVTTAERPVPWSGKDVPDNHVVAVLAPTQRFDTNLVESASGLGELPYICRKDEPADSG